MSDVSQGPGWWMASDGKWYPPESAPGYQQQGQQFGQVPGMMPNYPTGPNTTFVQVPTDALGRPLAGWWLRVAATLIDGLLMGAIEVAIRAGTGQSSYLATIASLIIVLAYQALMLASQGQTLGNMAAGTIVVDAATGAPVTSGKAWARSAMDVVFRVGTMLFVIPILVDDLWPLWDKQKQTLHDKVAGTVVVKRR